MDVEGLKLRDINLFLDLVKTKSIRELARQRGDLPGQISKTIRALEMKLGNALVHRSSHGVSLTAYGTEILPFLEGIRRYQQRLGGHLDSSDSQVVLSIATTSFFSSHFVPTLLGNLEKFSPDVHCRLIDLPPNQFIPVALRNGFEVCIHLNDLDWPKTWSSVEVGQIHWHLCCRKQHPLPRKAPLRTILSHSFVYPIYWTSEGIRHGDDYFPVSIKKRKRGFETTTATSAAHIVAQTDHIGFLPDLISAPLINQGLLRVIEAPAIKPVSQKVFLTVKSDVIKQQRLEWMRRQCQELLLNATVS